MILLGLLSTLLFGLRHGIDYDHIAAITDITSTRSNRRESMKLGLLYSLGHGLVVLLLGVLAIVFGQFLPHALDQWMERFVGVTLVMLGIYVIWSLVAIPRDEFRIVSRYHLLARGVGRVVARLLGRPASVDRGYSNKSSFVIGMIHGVGAETPTQLGIFLFAAGVGGKLLGFVGVILFVLGVVITNTIMCAVASGLFHSSLRRERLYRTLAGFTAGYSMIVGVLFLLGASDLLPQL